RGRQSRVESPRNRRSLHGRRSRPASVEPAPGTNVYADVYQKGPLQGLDGADSHSPHHYARGAGWSRSIWVGKPKEYQEPGRQRSRAGTLKRKEHEHGGKPTIASQKTDDQTIGVESTSLALQDSFEAASATAFC